MAYILECVTDELVFVEFNDFVYTGTVSEDMTHERTVDIVEQVVVIVEGSCCSVVV